MEYDEGILALNERQKEQIHKRSLNEFYKKSTTLGKGSFGVVRKIVHKKTGLLYAGKYIKKRKSGENFVRSIHHEIAILHKCKSKNIVKLHEVYETSSHITLILDYLAGGDLQSVMDKLECLSEADVKTVVKQVLETVCILHGQNIAHMDIKSENILLSEPNCFDNIKLCDFGLSKLVEPGTEVKTTNGTLDYVPPEVLTGDPITTKSDIWSIGILTYWLVCGYMPFKLDSDEETMKNIKKGIVEFEEESFEYVSNECIDFIKTMLIVDPKLRPTADELLKHVWFGAGE